MKKKISADFWDFIEKYIPNHSDRADVMRQSELQIFLNGQESSICNRSKQKARKELNKILNSLYFEAINNQSKGMGKDCDDCYKFIGKCAYCPRCGKKLVSHSVKPKLRITDKTGDTILIKLSTGKYPETYKKKCEEFAMEAILSQQEATTITNETVIELELFYSMGQGLFAVESEAVECISIFNPYNGTEIPNDNLEET